MPNHYTAFVHVERIYRVKVVAETEKDARDRATTLLDMSAEPDEAHVGKVQVRLDGKIDFSEGTRIKHPKFGPGVIKEVTGAYGPKPGMSFVHLVAFDDGIERRMSLGVIAEKIEILDK